MVGHVFWRCDAGDGDGGGGLGRLPRRITPINDHDRCMINPCSRFEHSSHRLFVAPEEKARLASVHVEGFCRALRQMFYVSQPSRHRFAVLRRHGAKETDHPASPILATAVQAHTMHSARWLHSQKNEMPSQIEARQSANAGHWQGEGTQFER